MSNTSISRPPFLSTFLAATIAVGAILATAPEADARGFGSKSRHVSRASSKANAKAKATTRAKTQRSPRRGLFSSRKKATTNHTTSASGTLYLHPTQIRKAQRQATRSAEVFSHSSEAAPKKRSLLARIFGPRDSEAAARAASRRPLRRLDRSSTRKLAPGQPNPVQAAPKIDHKLIAAKSSSSQSKIVVNIAKQRAYVYVDGKLAVDTPVSTARSGKSTPRGSFRVGERVAQGKISTIYKVSMPYWIRLGSSPYGMHAGYLPGYPASAGCIRLPHSAAEAIYKATGYSTRVQIVNG
jgi:lipoprotein-anchoring transpeptidase ErfK/SrfK